MPDPRRVGAAVAVGIALACVFLAAPPMGTDLAAQVARADFFAEHGWAPLDFGWYGGVSPYGYSLVSPPLMAALGGGLLGPRLLGALAAVVATAALAGLLVRTGAPRPVLGGTVGAACITANLVSGRITYALGVAFGLAALLALTSRRRWLAAGGALAGAALAAATSPVAGLFVGLTGTAWAASGLLPPRRPGRRRSRLLDGALLGVGAAGPMIAVAVLFGAGGWMNISRWDTARAAGASLIVALLVARPAVRIGALLSALGVLLAYAVHTPVGLNATRLAAMFALPVLAAYATVPGRRWAAAPGGRWRAGAVLALVLAAVAGWQPPVMTGDLRAAGDPAARAGFFAPLRAELARRAPAGRVEVVPLANYWEAAYVPDTAPLARGWLRQADLAHNPLFFDGDLSAREYRDWLHANGVSLVALADATPSWVGRAEAALIRGGPPYLSEVWRGGHWTLYEVAGGSSIVSGARLVEATRGGITLDAPAAGPVLVRVRWSRWLAVRGPAVGGPAGACLQRSGDWVRLTVAEPGRYEITGALRGRGPFCPVSALGVGQD